MVFAGVLWTPEARASETGEEWLRRMQTVVFSPMAMINAWSAVPNHGRILKWHAGKSAGIITYANDALLVY